MGVLPLTDAGHLLGPILHVRSIGHVDGELDRVAEGGDRRVRVDFDLSDDQRMILLTRRRTGLRRSESQYPSWPSTTGALVTAYTYDGDGNQQTELDRRVLVLKDCRADSIINFTCWILFGDHMFCVGNSDL